MMFSSLIRCAYVLGKQFVQEDTCSCLSYFANEFAFMDRRQASQLLNVDISSCVKTRLAKANRKFLVTNLTTNFDTAIHYLLHHGAFFTKNACVVNAGCQLDYNFFPHYIE